MKTSHSEPQTRKRMKKRIEKGISKRGGLTLTRPKRYTTTSTPNITRQLTEVKNRKLLELAWWPYSLELPKL